MSFLPGAPVTSNISAGGLGTSCLPDMPPCLWGKGFSRLVEGATCMRSTVRLRQGALLICLFGTLLCARADAPARSVEERIQNRTFPSVFQAWNPADNLTGENPLDTEARHDLLFHGPEHFGLRFNNAHIGLATGFTPDSLAPAREHRAALLKRNPNMVLLAEIRYRDAHTSYLPETHAWWKRDPSGKRVVGWEEGGYFLLDYGSPEFRAQVAKQCAAAIQSGVFDGVMLDWWEDTEDRLALVTRIRKEIGKEALILVNANDRQTPKTAPYINGYFMECYRTKTSEDWKRIADTLQWAEKNLRAPRINCLETWYHTSRRDLDRMRATTTMALTLSDGYCLFSDPNDLPKSDHLHDWYDFWDRSLGRPAGKGKKHTDGYYTRQFQKGIAVYNPPDNRPVTLTFAAPYTSRATGKRGREHRIDTLDGDIFLK